MEYSGELNYGMEYSGEFYYGMIYSGEFNYGMEYYGEFNCGMEYSEDFVRCVPLILSRKRTSVGKRKVYHTVYHPRRNIKSSLWFIKCSV